LPEILEVNAIVDALDHSIRGGTISKIEFSHWFTERKIKKKPDQFGLSDLVGWTFTGVVRVGKGLVFKLENPGIGNRYIASRLGMSGHWSLKPGHQIEPKNKHWAVNIWLSNGQDQGSLIYSDTRGFGTMEIRAEWQELTSIQIYGPPIDGPHFTVDWVKHACSRTSMPIKCLLLRQEYFPGVGNYLASEILFSGHIHPSTPAKKMNTDQIKRLFDAIHLTIHRCAEGGGASLYSWKDAHGKSGKTQDLLLVYKRKDMPCFVCETPIKKETIGGRGTFYCEVCQSPDWTPPAPVSVEFVEKVVSAVREIDGL
jgi:formamidopyrimidine-DNA glycosylase